MRSRSSTRALRWAADMYDLTTFSFMIFSAKGPSRLHPIRAEAHHHLRVLRPFAALVQRVFLGIDAVAGVAEAVGAFVVAEGQGQPAVELDGDDHGGRILAVVDGALPQRSAAAGG